MASPVDGYGIYESISPDSPSSLTRLDAIAAGGFRLVMNYDLLYATASNITRYIQRASSVGLKVIIALHYPSIWKTTAISSSFPELYTNSGNQSTASGFTTYVVNLVKGLPGVWGYYVGDEPDNSDHTSLKTHTTLIASLDATHPRLIIAGGSSTNSVASGTNVFADCCDVLGDDQYPIGDDSFTRTTAAAATAVQSFTTTNNVQSAFALQAFSWTQYPPSRTSGTATWPTYAQMRQARDDTVANMSPRLILWYSYFDVVNNAAPYAQWISLIGASNNVTTNPIPAENANTGTTAWICTQAASTQIQAYADKVALDPGSTLNFYVSTQVAGTTYSINIYRLGYYGGTGATLKAAVTGQVGVAQGYWNNSSNTLVSCPTAIIDTTTHLVEAGWASSYTYTVPGNAVTGVYVAQFVDANGYQTYCTFVVRGNTTADYVYVRPVTTDVAYNNWGGYSFYTTTPAVKASFNRPIVGGRGTDGLFRFEMNFLKWAEGQGYNISYLTNVDVHENAAQLLNYKSFLSPGHDEYWSKEMRDGVEAALVQGVGLAFLGANAAYWQIRFEADAASHADHTITCYKCGVGALPLSNDPYYGVDNTRVTTQWRLPPVNRPEATMIGIMYSSYIAQNANLAWIVSTTPSYTYLPGTLTPGQAYGYDLVGYEFDKVQSSSPKNIQIIGYTPIVDIYGNANISHTTVYQAPSGAIVFASGSIGWTQCLDAYRFSVQAGGTPVAIVGMQTFMANVMNALVQGKLASPSVTALFGVYH